MWVGIFTNIFLNKDYFNRYELTICLLILCISMCCVRIIFLDILYILFYICKIKLNKLFISKLYSMKRMMIKKFRSLEELSVYFSTNQKCKDYLAMMRWNGEPECPYCHSKIVYHKCDGRYACVSCGNTFSVLVGTIFQNTKLSLLIWFKAIYLVVNSKSGISSCQLAGFIGVTQKTAWFMLQKIRILLRDEEDEFPDKVMGTIVEKRNNDNVPYKIRVADKPHRIHPKLLKYVQESSRIFEDDCICYQSLDESGLEMFRIEDPFPLGIKAHKSREKYVVDAFWQQLKRMIMGVYHYVSIALFHRYIYEALYRCKVRRMSNEEKFMDAFGRMFSVVDYKIVRPK